MLSFDKYNSIMLTIVFAIALIIISVIAIYDEDPLQNIRVYENKSIIVGSDFNANYFAAKRYFSSDSLYFVQQQKLIFSDELSQGDSVSRFVYYPFSALFFVPLSVFNFEIAFFILTTINIIFLLCVVLFLTNYVQNKKSFFGVIMLLLLFSPVLWSILERGQTDIIIIFFISLCFHFFLKKKYKLSGISLALASLFKLTPLFLLPFFFFTNRKVSISTIITFVIISFFLGLEKIMDFIRALTVFSSNHSSSYMSTGLFGLFYNNVTSRFIEAELAHTIYIIIIVPLLLIFFYLFYKKFLDKNNNFSYLVGFAIFLVVMILLPPVAWLQHDIHLLFSITAYWIIREHIPFSKKIIYMDTMILLIFSSPMLLLTFQEFPLSIIFALRPLYVLVFLILLLLILGDFNKLSLYKKVSLIDVKC